MDNDQGGAGVGGSCSAPPTADNPAAEHVPNIGHTARIACNFRKVGSDPGYYTISWAVDDLLMTGTFLSDPGADAGAYQQLYGRALDVLKQV
jgi:hypothetical protein